MEHTFEQNWKFTRNIAENFQMTDCDDSGWEIIDLPHDWAIKGPFSEENDAEITIIDAAGGQEWQFRHPGRTGGLPHVGKGFYRKKFVLPDVKGKHVRVEFDGVMSWAKVYCNGHFITERPYGYSSFQADITETVQEGENLLAVSVENLPGASRWYPGAGIYRHVRLVISDRIHIAPWGVRVTTKGNTVSVLTELDNPTQQEIELTTSLLDSEGNTLRVATNAGTETVQTFFELPDAKKWQPGMPNLYTIVSELTGERRKTRFGFRDMKFDAHKGFSINGVSMKFQGVCLHHDLGIIGAAVDQDVTRHRLELLASIGCNAIRTVHNPPDPELLDICDEMGFLVICEAYDEWLKPKCPNGSHLHFREWGECDLRDMIRRDANHPCVMMWSIGNEIDEQYCPEGPEMTRWLCRICHDEDSTRPVTAGLNNGDDSITGGLFDDVDVKGFNYKPYLYSIYHCHFPDAPLYSSESASTISSRGEYSDCIFEYLGKKENLQIDSFDLCNSPGATIPDHEFKGQDDNPFVMGEFVWTGFDYLGEPTPYREEWPVRSSFYGIFDLCGIPKDRAYLYKSRWCREKVLHLMPHGNWEGYAHVPVQCYTNYQTVELMVNGRSMGRKTRNIKKMLGYYRLVWPSVPYEPGEIRVRALDTEGNVLAEKMIRTADEPTQLRLETSRSGQTVFVTASLLDREGNLCPNASDRIFFESTGKVLAADAGNPSSIEPFHTPDAMAFHGKCAAIIRSKELCSVRAFLERNGKIIAAEAEKI